MKRILFLVVAVSTVACSGIVDPHDVNSGSGSQDIPDEYVEPFTLVVDKAEAEASGEDFVTFALNDSYGRDLLQDKNALQSVNITSEEGLRVPRMDTKVAFIANGVYNFSATFKGQKSVNTVEVQAKNRAKYEVFHRNVGLFKCTSVWCSACPYLGASLYGLSESVKEHSVILAVHGDFDGKKDPFSLYVSGMDLGSYLMGRFGKSSLPTMVYDMNYAKSGTKTTSDLEAEIYQRRLDSPATCGFKVNSVEVEDGALKVNVVMKSSVGGDYDLACAVLRDGLEYQGAFSVNEDGIYDEVVIAMSESALGYYKGQELAAGEEYEEVFSFDFGGNVPSAEHLKSYYVAVYAYRKTAEGSTMDNIITCGYGETVDYHLND